MGYTPPDELFGGPSGVSAILSGEASGSYLYENTVFDKNLQPFWVLLEFHVSFGMCEYRNQALCKESAQHIFYVRWKPVVRRFDQQKASPVKGYRFLRVDQIWQGCIELVHHPGEYPDTRCVTAGRIATQSSVYCVGKFSHYSARLVLKLHVSMVGSCDYNVCPIPRSHASHCQAFFYRRWTIVQSGQYVGIYVDSRQLTN